MNHTWVVADVCNHTHTLRDLSLEEAFGRIGPLWPCSRDGDEGRIMQLSSGRLVFFPDRLRLVRD